MRTTSTVHPDSITYHINDAWHGCKVKRTKTDSEEIKWLLLKIVMLGKDVNWTNMADSLCKQ